MCVRWEGTLLVCAVETFGTFVITLTAALASMGQGVLGASPGDTAPPVPGTNSGIAIGCAVTAMVRASAGGKLVPLRILTLWRSGSLIAQVAVGEHVSGGEFNPAVTLATAIRYQVKPNVYPRVVAVILSQFAGGVLAGFAAALISGNVRAVLRDVLPPPVSAASCLHRRCRGRRPRDPTTKPAPCSMSSCGPQCWCWSC